MSMNGISDIDDYDSFNFHLSAYEQMRPMHMTTHSFIYPLCSTADDTNSSSKSTLTNSPSSSFSRQYVYNADGKPTALPRSLLMLCINKIVTNERAMQRLNERTVSANLFALIFREAILFGEFSLIAHLISIWPTPHLKLSELISHEIINVDSLSKPLFTCGPTILDYVLLGVLISKPCSRLKTIDFTGFHKDLKLTREICHLPLLYFYPENRNYDNIYEKIKSHCNFEKNSLCRYLDNFNEIYQEYDRLIQHEVNYEEKHLIIDCHINCEDVTLGLALQSHTPFRFHSRKVWCSYGFAESEYSFKNYDLLALINPNHITHLCLKDLFMIETPSDILHLCSVLEQLTNIRALSLIRVLNFYPTNYTNAEIHQVCSRINKTLRRSGKLNKIDFSFNYLRSRLHSLLRHLAQPLEYLNLQDCRLDPTDVAFLNTAGMLNVLQHCKELNLSMNDFSQSHAVVLDVVANCTHLNCLSLSYCQIPVDVLCQRLVYDIVLRGQQQQLFAHLKVVYIQPYTPPKMDELMDLLYAFGDVKSLQKFCFLPSLYAFAGANDYERECSALKIFQICTSILESRGRADIDFLHP